MQFTNSVTVSPDFFAHACNDYADFWWAFVREFMQNCMDAPGSQNIKVAVGEQDGHTYFTIWNDGAPMTKGELTGKLLALGGSGKNFEGTVGGFGKAKEILYFCHAGYEIITGGLHVEGRGSGYNLHAIKPEVGTASKITIAGDHEEELTNYVERFVSLAQWRGTVWLNGKEVNCSLHKGSPRRKFDFGTVYTNRAFSGVMVVRVNGIPMFWENISPDRCVVVELSGTSQDTLTSNRDGLKSPYCYNLSEFVTELAVDNKSALRSPDPKYIRYKGAKLRYLKSTTTDVRDIVYAEDPVQSTLSDALAAQKSAAHRPVESPKTEPMTSVQTTLSHQFVVKNTTGLVVPSYYLPESFGTYSQKLVRIWGRVLLELHELFEIESQFSIGFLFDEENEAEFEKTDEYGEVFYISPVVLREQNRSKSRSFAKRFRLTERDRLLAIATHELVHAFGHTWHDETYANRLTDTLATVMAKRRRFNSCFR